MAELKLKQMVYATHSGETTKYAGYAAMFAYKKGFIPINPYLIFGGYYVNTWLFSKGSKIETHVNNASVFKHCSEFWIFGENRKDCLRKKGVKKELEMFKEINPNGGVKYFTWKEAGVPKYAYPDRWHN